MRQKNPVFYAVNKEIPIPAARNYGCSEKIAKMRVGENMLVPISNHSAYALATKIYGEPGHIRCRKEGAACRVWRIA